MRIEGTTKTQWKMETMELDRKAHALQKEADTGRQRLICRKEDEDNIHNKELEAKTETVRMHGRMVRRLRLYAKERKGCIKKGIDNGGHRNADYQ